LTFRVGEAGAHRPSGRADEAQPAEVSALALAISRNDDVVCFFRLDLYPVSILAKDKPLEAELGGALECSADVGGGGVMEGLTSSRFGDLVRACAPALQNLLSETTGAPELPLFGDQAREKALTFYSEATLAKLTARERKAAEDAAELFRYFENKADGANFAPAFNTLLGPFDEAAKALVIKLLQGAMPANRAEQDNWFDPYMGTVEHKQRERYQKLAKNLKRGLIYGNIYSVIGILCACLDYALNDNSRIDGVFKIVREAFRFSGARNLLTHVSAANDFRNTYIAHHQKDLTDKRLAETNLKHWAATLALLRTEYAR
jgi:type III restriction enzyme